MAWKVRITWCKKKSSSRLTKSRLIFTINYYVLTVPLPNACSSQSDLLWDFLLCKWWKFMKSEIVHLFLPWMGYLHFDQNHPNRLSETKYRFTSELTLFCTISLAPKTMHLYHTITFSCSCKNRTHLELWIYSVPSLENLCPLACGRRARLLFLMYR